MAEVLTSAQMDFELLVTRVLNRKTALVGKRTCKERRERIKALIIEHGVQDQLIDSPDGMRVTFGNAYKAVYGRRKAAA